MKQPERRFLIGRATECDVVLDDPSVSRRHAALVLTETGHWLLVDRQSQNGTWVGADHAARRIGQEVITAADVLRFGTVTMSGSELQQRVRSRLPPTEVLADEPPRPAASPPPAPWARGASLVRCACGAVKPKHAPCPECGNQAG